MKSPRRPGGTTARWTIGVLAVAVLVIASVVAAVGARASGTELNAGPALGKIPARAVGHAGGGGGGGPLVFHGGPVQTSGANHAVYPIFWGPAWANSYSSTKSGIAGSSTSFYGGLGGTSYAQTNDEYTNRSNQHVDPSATLGTIYSDTGAAPSGAPSTSQVLAEVAKVVPSSSLVAGAYYPVYSDQPRGSAGYCAWHSSGTIGSKTIQFAFFFSLANDAGCSPYSGSSQVINLGNVSGHEWSEMETDPQLNAWYDHAGNENADKCAWKFNGTQHFSNGSSWTIQGNWSNAHNGCIWGS
jgi:hypothetical protein